MLPLLFRIHIALLLALDQEHFCIYWRWLMQKRFQGPRGVKFHDSSHNQIFFLSFCIGENLLLISSLVEQFYCSSTCWKCPRAIQQFRFGTLAFRQKCCLVHLLCRFSVYEHHLELNQPELDLCLICDTWTLLLCSIQKCRLSLKELTDVLIAQSNVPTFLLSFSEALLRLQPIYLGWGLRFWHNCFDWPNTSFRSSLSERSCFVSPLSFSHCLLSDLNAFLSLLQ